MSGRYSRRRLLAGFAAGASASFVGCSSFEALDSGSTTERSIGGRVVDTDGTPIPNATVDARAPTTNTQSAVSTDDDGRFGLEVDGPVWLRVRKDGYNQRVKAAASGDVTRIQLSRSDAVSLAFGGDVMFGRRFYGSEEADGRPRYRIDETRPLESHREILSDIAPLLSSADISSVNLESPLTTTDWRHTRKTYAYVSDPTAADAMAEAGIDYASIGNNHALDGLTPGLDDTLDALDSAGIARSGAGFSAEKAWEPAIIERNEHSVAILSCTTVVRSYYDIDLSANGDPSRVHVVDPTEVEGVDDDEDPLRFPDTAGAAEASPDDLKKFVDRAKETADTVVVQIHGGEPYQRHPTPEIEKLVDAAIEAGADLVVNHHPHVTGGVERRDGALVAWSLGNLVFDQEIWATLQSYLLTVDIDGDGVVRASTEPVVLQGYVPKPAVGRTHEQLARRTGELSAAPMTYTADGTLTPPDDADSRTATRRLSGESVFAVTGSLVGADPTANVSLGRDRLLFGRFRNDLVSGRPTEGPLWRFGRERASIGPDVGYGTFGGIELTRTDVHSGRSFLSPRYRIPVSGDPLTLTGLYAFEGQAGFELLVSWYKETSGESFRQRRVEPTGTDGAWRRFEYDLSPPPNANYVDVFVFLTPPDDGERLLRLDDLRLVEWGADLGPGADHVAVEGSATVELETHGGVAPSAEPLVDPDA